MGALLWLTAGGLAFALARIVPAGRTRRWRGELAATLLAGLALGVAATALDFGGWKELEWRAGTFALLGALGAAGAVRAYWLLRAASRNRAV
ncbi:MAG TPA: hypothetical protein VF701_19740 [Thermoanaerobaculia bacterium]